MQAVLVQAATIQIVVFQILIKLQLHLDCGAHPHNFGLSLDGQFNMFWNITFLGEKDLSPPLYLQTHAKIVTILIYGIFVIWYKKYVLPLDGGRILIFLLTKLYFSMYFFLSKEKAKWKSLLSICWTKLVKLDIFYNWEKRGVGG